MQSPQYLFELSEKIPVIDTIFDEPDSSFTNRYHRIPELRNSIGLEYNGKHELGNFKTRIVSLELFRTSILSRKGQNITDIFSSMFLLSQSST